MVEIKKGVGFFVGAIDVRDDSGYFIEVDLSGSLKKADAIQMLEGIDRKAWDSYKSG